jgi:hypothetical protein
VLSLKGDKNRMTRCDLSHFLSTIWGENWEVMGNRIRI